MGIFEDLTKPISQQSDTSDFDFDAYLQEKTKPYKKKTVASDPTSEFTPEKVTKRVDGILGGLIDLAEGGFNSLEPTSANVIATGLEGVNQFASDPIGTVNKLTLGSALRLGGMIGDAVTNGNGYEKMDKWLSENTESGVKLFDPNTSILRDASEGWRQHSKQYSEKNPIPDSFMGELGAGGTSFSMTVVPTVITALATKNPATVAKVAQSLGYALETSSQYQDLLDSGYKPEEAMTGAHTYGIMASILEKHVPEKIAGGLTKDFLKKGYKKLFKEMTERGTLEGFTEVTQDVLATSLKWNKMDDKQKDEYLKGLPSQAARTFAVSFMLGVAGGLPGDISQVKNKKSQTKLEEEFGTGEEITTETVIESEQIAKPEVEEVKLTPEQQLKKVRNDAISAEYKATIKSIDDSKAEIRREVNRLNGELKIAKNDNEIIDEKRISGELAKLKEQLKSLDSQRKTAKEDAIKKIDEVENLKENEPTEGLPQEKSPVDLFNQRMKETNFEQQTADLQKLTPTEATEPQTPVKGMEVKAEVKEPVKVDTPDDIYYTGRGKKYENLGETKGEFIFFSKDPDVAEWYGGDKSNITEAKLDTKNFLDLTTQEKKAKFVDEQFTDKDIQTIYKFSILDNRDARVSPQKYIKNKIDEARDRLREERFSGDNKEQKLLLKIAKDRGYDGIKLSDAHFGKEDISYVVINKNIIKQSKAEVKEPVKEEAKIKGAVKENLTTEQPKQKSMVDVHNEALKLHKSSYGLKDKNKLQRLLSAKAIMDEAGYDRKSELYTENDRLINNIKQTLGIKTNETSLPVKEAVRNIEETKYEMRKSKGGWSVDKKENNNWGFVQQFRTKKEAQNYIDSKQKPEVSNVKEEGETLLEVSEAEPVKEPLVKKPAKPTISVGEFGDEINGAKYKRYESENGYLEIGVRNEQPFVYTIKVNEANRGEGEGKKLLQRAIEDYPNLKAQASNDIAVKMNYSLGLRAFDKDGTLLTLEQTLQRRAENTSVGMIKPEYYNIQPKPKEIVPKKRTIRDVRKDQSKLQRELGGLLGYWLRNRKSLSDAEINASISNSNLSLKEAKDKLDSWIKLEKEQYELELTPSKDRTVEQTGAKTEPISGEGEISKIETDNNRPPRTKDEINKLSITVKQLESEIEKLENLSSETVLTDKAKYREVNDRLDEISPEYWHKKQLLEAAEFEQEYLGGKEPHEVKKADFDEAESAYSKAEAKRIYNKKKINANTVKEFIDKHGGYSNLSYSKYKEKHDGITISQKGARKKKYIVKQDAPQSGFYQSDKYTEFNSIEDAVNYVNDIYKERYKDDYSVYDYWELGHKDIVRIALKEGKSVPEEVLKDYPELKPSKDRIVEQTGATGTETPVSKRVFSEDGYKKDRKDASNILNRPNFIGAQLEAVPQMLRIAGYHLENVVRAGIEKGRQFTEWTKSMIKDLGGKIRPYLKKIWEETQRQFGKKLLQYAEKNPFIRSMNVVEGSLFTNDNLPPVDKKAVKAEKEDSEYSKALERASKNISESELKEIKRFINNLPKEAQTLSKLYPKQRNRFMEKVGLATKYYGKAGGEIMKKLHQGNMKAKEFYTFGHNLINQIKEINADLGTFARQDVYNKVTDALQNQENAKEILGNDQNAIKTYNRAVKFYRFFRDRLKEKGIPTRDDYFTHILKTSIYDEIGDIGTPDSKKFLNKKISAESAFTKERIREEMPIDRNIENVMSRYLSSITKELAYKDAIDYYYNDFIKDVPKNKQAQQGNSYKLMQQIIDSNISPEIAGGRLFGLANKARNNLYKAFLWNNVRAAAINNTQKTITKMLISKDVAKLVDKTYRQKSKLTGKLADVVALANSETPLYGESKDDFTEGRLDKINLFSIAEKSNWKYSELAGIIKSLSRQKGFMELANKEGINKAAEKYLSDQNVFDNAVKEGMDLAAQTQVSPTAAYRPFAYDVPAWRLIGMFTRYKAFQLEMIGKTLIGKLDGAEGLRAQQILRRGVTADAKPVEVLSSVETLRKQLEEGYSAAKKENRGLPVSTQIIEKYINQLKKEEKELNNIIKEIEPLSGDKKQLAYGWAKYTGKIMLISTMFNVLFDILHRAIGLKDDDEKTFGDYVLRAFTDASPAPFNNYNPQDILSPPILPNLDVFIYGKFNKRGFIKSLADYMVNVTPLGVVNRLGQTITGISAGNIAKDTLAPKK